MLHISADEQKARLTERTSAGHAPWYVVPANHKWYARLAASDTH